MSKHVSDIRSTSYDARYAGVVFGGVDTIDEAIAQAKAAPNFGFPLDARVELEGFLRCASRGGAGADQTDFEAERDSLIPAEPIREAA